MSQLLLMSNPRKRTRARRVVRRRAANSPFVLMLSPPRRRRRRYARRYSRVKSVSGRATYGRSPQLVSLFEQALPLGGGFAAGLYVPKLLFPGKDRTPVAYLTNLGIGMTIPMLTRFILSPKMAKSVGIGYIAAQMVKLFDDLFFRDKPKFKALNEGMANDDVPLLDYAEDEEVVSAGEGEDENVVEAGPDDVVVVEDADDDDGIV